MWWLKSPMVGSPELSLVLFTVLGQMSVGAIVFLLFTRLTQKEQSVSADAVALTRQVVLVSLVLMVAGVVASLAHLGQAMRVYRALFYHLSTWMGMETVFLGLFSISLLLYAFLLLRGSGPKIGVEFFAAFTGLLGVLSSSLVYTVLGSVPSWNNVFSILFFFLTFVLMGASLFGAIIYKSGSGADTEKNLAASYMKSFTAIFTPLLVVATLLTFGYLFYLQSRGPEGAASMQAMIGSPLFWLRVIVGFVAPLLLVVALKKLVGRGEISKAGSYVYGVFVLLLAGEVLGRVLFFSSSVMHTIGGNGTPY